MMLANAFAATLIVAVVPIIAVELLGATVTQTLLLESLYYAAKLFAAPQLGKASDKHGRKRILLICQAGTAFAFLLFVLALQAEREPAFTFLGFQWQSGLILLYLGKLIDGATAGNSTIAKAYITDVASPERQSELLGWQASTLGVAFVVGPAIGGWLSAQFNLTTPFLVAAIATVAALMVGIFSLPESAATVTETELADIPRSRHSFWQLVDARFASILLVGFGTTLCFGALFAISTLYIRAELFVPGSDPAAIAQYAALVLTSLGLTLAGTQLLINGKISRQFTGDQIIRYCLPIIVVNLIWLPFVRGRLLFIIALIPMTVAFGLLEPNLQALVANISQRQRGERLGIFQATNSLADLLGPLLVGLIFDLLYPGATWLSGALLMAGTAIAYQLLRIWQNRPGSTNTHTAFELSEESGPNH